MASFLLTTIAVSLSGVMSPGPVTAAALAAGTRSRHAGAMIAVGHAIVELPLIFLLVAGLGSLLQSPIARIGIGLAGGIVLWVMGVQLLRSLRVPAAAVALSGQHPLIIGVALTAGNPFFLLWWATVGLALAAQAVVFGVVGLLVFAFVHWLCDLVWLEFLSMAGRKSSQTFGDRAQTTISLICGVALVGFGAYFLWDAGLGMLRAARASGLMGCTQPLHLLYPGKTENPVLSQGFSNRCFFGRVW